MDIRDSNEVYAIIEKFYPRSRLLPKTMYGIEEIIKEMESDNYITIINKI